MLMLAVGDDAEPAFVIIFIVLMAIVMIAVAFAIFDLRRHLRGNAAARGLCSRCAYDLRTGHERCPECGEPVPPSPETPSVC